MSEIPDREPPKADPQKLFEAQVLASKIDREFLRGKGVDPEVHMLAVAVLATVTSVIFANTVEGAEGVLGAMFGTAKSGIPSTFHLKTHGPMKQ
jgi:hypothetical protein